MRRGAAGRARASPAAGARWRGWLGPGAGCFCGGAGIFWFFFFFKHLLKASPGTPSPRSRAASWLRSRVCAGGRTTVRGAPPPPPPSSGRRRSAQNPRAPSYTGPSPPASLSYRGRGGELRAAGARTAQAAAPRLLPRGPCPASPAAGPPAPAPSPPPLAAGPAAGWARSPAGRRSSGGGRGPPHAPKKSSRWITGAGRETPRFLGRLSIVSFPQAAGSRSGPAPPRAENGKLSATALPRGPQPGPEGRGKASRGHPALCDSQPLFNRSALFSPRPISNARAAPSAPTPARAQGFDAARGGGGGGRVGTAWGLLPLPARPPPPPRMSCPWQETPFASPARRCPRCRRRGRSPGRWGLPARRCPAPPPASSPDPPPFKPEEERVFDAVAKAIPAAGCEAAFPALPPPSPPPPFQSFAGKHSR